MIKNKVHNEHLYYFNSYYETSPLNGRPVSTRHAKSMMFNVLSSLLDDNTTHPLTELNRFEIVDLLYNIASRENPNQLSEFKYRNRDELSLLVGQEVKWITATDAIAKGIVTFEKNKYWLPESGGVNAETVKIHHQILET